MKRFLEIYLKTALEYLPIVLTILVCLYVVLINQLEPLSDSQILSWILTIITLLATSILIDRFFKLNIIDKTTRETKLMLTESKKSVTLDSVISTRKKLPPLEDRLAQSREVLIFGGSLLRLTNEYISCFESKAQLGCKLKFLLLDPNCEAVKFVAESIVYEVNEVNDYRNHLQTSQTNLKKLQNKYPGFVEVRLHNIVPTFSLLASRAEKDEHSSTMVEFYTYLTPTRERPHLLIEKLRDPLWHHYFASQFEAIWIKSRELSD